MNKRLGFTLMELLVVIAIMGMLAGMIFPTLGKARIRARKAKAISELKSIELALMEYYVEYSSFPTNANTTKNGIEKLTPLFGEEYLDIPLIDPFSDDEIYRYYACTDNVSGGKGTDDVADSCLVFSLGPDWQDNDIGASSTPFDTAYNDAYPPGGAEPLSDNIYLILPLSDIRYKK